MKKITHKNSRNITVRLAGIILVLALTRGLTAQPERDFAFYNDTTYQLYLAEDWRQLIPLGREALNRDYDYYYLRMRLGIAYQALNRHFQAVPQFYQALSFNQQDIYARDYLYQNLMAGGRLDEARMMERTSPAAFRLLNVGAEVGFKNSDNESLISDQYFVNTSLRHQMGKHWFLTHSFQYLTQQFIDTMIVLIPGNGNRPPREIRQLVTTSIDQSEYWLGAAYQGKNGWRIEGGFRYIAVNGTEEQDDTDRILALNLRKDGPFFRIQAGAGWSDMGFSEQLQWQAGVLLFPLGSPHLYLGSTAIFSREEEEGQDQWFAQILGFRLFPDCWLEGYYDTGDINYFYRNNGALTYNIPTRFQRRWGLSWQYWIKARHLLYLTYVNEEKEWLDLTTRYHQHAFLLGLSLNFN